MMLHSLIINILAALGALTITLIALALWTFVSDEEFHEREGLRRSIPSMQSEEK